MDRGQNSQLSPRFQARASSCLLRCCVRDPSREPSQACKVAASAYWLSLCHVCTPPLRARATLSWRDRATSSYVRDVSLTSTSAAAAPAILPSIPCPPRRAASRFSFLLHPPPYVTTSAEGPRPVATAAPPRRRHPVARGAALGRGDPEDLRARLNGASLMEGTALHRADCSPGGGSRRPRIGPCVMSPTGAQVTGLAPAEAVRAVAARWQQGRSARACWWQGWHRGLVAGTGDGWRRPATGCAGSEDHPRHRRSCSACVFARAMS